MRVLLVNSNLKGDVLAAPPIGLSYVATATERAGHEVEVLDLCFRRDLTQALRHSIERFIPDVVGISIRNIDNCNMLHPRSYLPDILRIVRQVRGLTDARIVLGGSGASLYPEGVLRYLEGDYIVVSEGEESFPLFLDKLDGGEPLEEVPGLGFVRNGRFVLTPPHLMSFRHGSAYVGKWIDLRPYQRMGSSYNIQTRRGCRQKCIYCTYNQLLEGKSLRLRDPVDVAEEIEEALLRYRPDSFEFVDSVFNDPMDHCAAILEEIASRPWKAQFTAMGVSPRGLTRNFLKLLRRAGFHSFWITPESASETMIYNYRKGFVREDIEKAAETLRGSDFTVLWDFLIGGPGETNQTLRETIDFIQRNLSSKKRPPYYTVNLFLGVRAYPGTALWDLALTEGFFTEESDPLRQLWYLSPSLDLPSALDQMVQAARACPEIISGIDEKYLPLSGVASLIGRFVKVPKLYWRLMYAGNRLIRRPAIRLFFDRDSVLNGIREQLRSQGYGSEGN